ncbi:hypothetical protein K435DRAFT_843105 [Dendrothele bispora CBS 962.96]|uniref:Uncharacterized protein n=1 Tax=Dendrothele bispora (strain CBS 962.96) TaxID=1314807 RepID=A0A4S8LB92_DENBC|nr:hypothetical protein K435DRAFT_843105 [Dendrothele bispora CBS 962.96]
MNSRPPPQGAPSRYAFVGRVYGRNIRPVVITFAFLAFLWTLFAAIGSFRSIGIERSEGFSKLAVIAIVLGVLYITVCLFEAFGVFAAWSQRTPLVRIYTFLSAATTLIVIGGGIFEIIVHFTMKSDIIGICTRSLTGEGFVEYPFGFFGPRRSGTITASEANEWCNDAWSHDSWADIVGLLILIFQPLVISSFFTVTAFAYYRQLLDPTSIANVTRAPQNRMGPGYPQHYNPPYDGSVPPLGYQYGPPPNGQPPYGQPPYGGYAPPPGPPPGHQGYDVGTGGKPPGFSGADGNVGYGVDDKENPFADFDEPAHGPGEERDVTSRPGPGGRDTFR